MDSDNNYVYTNIYFYNATGSQMPVLYNESRTTPIVNKGEDYEMTIVRYSIPIHLLPLFIYDPNKYTIGLNNRAQQALNGYQNAENNYSSSDIRSRYVMNVKSWVDYLNTELLELAFPGYCQLSIINDRLVWIVDASYVSRYQAPATNTITMNEALYTQFFSGFPAVYDATSGIYTLKIDFMPSDYTYHATNQYADPNTGNPVAVDLFNFRDSFNSLASWGIIRRVVFLTNNIQLVNETISSRVYSLTESAVQNNSANMTILTDFETPFNNSPIEKDYLFYQPQEYRYITINHHGPIQKLDLAVFFEDPMSATFYPLCMMNNTDVSMKIMWRKKKENRKS